eukprot:m.135386 g.135386  ORF g.135386 m.135386 type:complete len:250 (-) comp13973_c0_seq3:1107-1856(-)
MAYATQETRAVLHFDADCFFCQVECKRRGLDISSIAVCAQQHQDIISVNTKAKEAGVKKHMLPAEARKLLDPINGRVLHVYCEPTCGRVSYAPYRAASRQIIALIRSYLPSKAIVEVASIDELYVALPGTLRDAEALAATIRSAVLQKLGYVMSAGIAGNRLLSKLASNVAKPNGTLTLHTRYAWRHNHSSNGRLAPCSPSHLTLLPPIPPLAFLLFFFFLRIGIQARHIICTCTYKVLKAPWAPPLSP